MVSIGEYKVQVNALMELWHSLDVAQRQEYLLELWQRAKSRWPQMWSVRWVGHPQLKTRLASALDSHRKGHIEPYMEE
ncbi:hypothetical protein HNR62_000317 [Oceanisphaera litoralis]|uniref:hypothetical protein n=1 Tax=Oceanisphaera litoralis TaxID=225144 RepID=UPI00195A06DF|nr:hypothetical protein [Oceanisphaera litoralis]MBM7454488.1 hypothetical protein [Oceanisphaera litoralis]